ncbi:ankyrin repeat protein [Trichuris suis]|nr:ankyrin repeat protein [Trichuris suis]
MPSHRDDLIDVIQEAVSNGLIVVNCSQCLRGRVDPAYETGRVRTPKYHRWNGAILTSVDHMRRTSLHYAAALGELEMVQFLLSEGVSVHTKCWLSKDTFCRADLFSPFRDNSNSTPLLEAIRGHHIAIVELLRKSGAHLTIEPLNLCVNLAMAAASNNLDAMKSWKAAEADLSVVDWEGRTALHVLVIQAASMGNQEMVSYLLDNGVSPFSTDHIGHSALDKALLNKHGGCAKLIRQFMANQANSADA